MKKVSTTMYVHKSNLKELLSAVPYLERLRIESIVDKEKEHWDYAVVKYNTKTKKLSLVQSPNFDTANEPTVGDSLVINILTMETKTVNKKHREQIYHCKETFVANDYPGFDVKKARARTQLWQTTIPDLKYHQSRIGYREYWQILLRAYDIED